MKLNVLLIVMIAFAATTLLALQGCRDQQIPPHDGQMPHHQYGSDYGLPSSNTDTEPDIVFTLRTAFQNREFLFIGASENYEDQLNPDLEVRKGNVVEIILVNGDGIIHDLAIPELGVATERISQKEMNSSLSFLAETAGIYTYYCTVPGHREAGMEGIIIISN